MQGFIHTEVGTHGADAVTAAPGEPLFAFGGHGDDNLTGGDLADLLSGGPGHNILSGFGGADQFLFQAASAPDHATVDLITDFDTTSDTLVLQGVGPDFDPMAHLIATQSGAVLDLGDAGQVQFLGHLATDFIPPISFWHD
jgi:serralysin